MWMVPVFKVREKLHQQGKCWIKDSQDIWVEHILRIYDASAKTDGIWDGNENSYKHKGYKPQSGVCVSVIMMNCPFPCCHRLNGFIGANKLEQYTRVYMSGFGMDALLNTNHKVYWVYSQSIKEVSCPRCYAMESNLRPCSCEVNFLTIQLCQHIFSSVCVYVCVHMHM